MSTNNRTLSGSVAPIWHRLRKHVPVEIPGAVAVTLAGAVLATTVAPFRALDWSLWVIFGLLALSFTFVWGRAGIFSFGQTAFFGIGAYAYGVLGIDLFPQTGETTTALVAAVVIAAVVAATLGYFIFYGNVGDVYVSIITLAFTLVLLTFMSSTADPSYHIGQALLGGYNGIVGVPPLMLPGGGQMVSPNGLLFTCVAVAAFIGFGIHLLLRRPFGRILAGLRENELRTELLGYDVRRYKLVAFTIGGAIAGLAGGLFAAWGTSVNPNVFSLPQAALVPIWVLVGGRRSLLGAFVGVAIVQGVSDALGGGGGSATPIVLGTLLIAVVVLLPEGVLPTLSALARRFVPALGRASVAAGPAGRTGSPLGDSVIDDSVIDDTVIGGESRKATSITAVDVHKRFGGVAALAGASLEVAPNGVHCLIGPNGAGKSTFFNMLAGRYRPTSGTVLLGDEQITLRRPDERARRGIGIKLQVPSLYGELTAFENVWLAAYGAKRDIGEADVRARGALAWLHLSEKARQPAGELSHGERQWLEIGMVMASDPKVVLLDEPTAGMTREETMRVVELIHDLARTATVIVVEHDMEFVRQLGAPVTMFHEGRIFTSGSIEQLRADERVLDIYLGRGTSHAAH
ncbi:ABC transporter permease subunit [Streptomyces fulvoviolaceus]|uniref:ABC transporter permease subunit n=1 Tax=Streptomyces fulvoviolaceus TaxID=285535 RepID=UPI000694B262|nr:ATP-binding cassette domain-containing protein [Streptomyces fulvoviolaceus]